MRLRTVLLILLAGLIITCSIAAGENSGTDSIICDEWDWDNEAVNTFTGSVNLSGWSGTELTLTLKAAFEPESKSASETIPKFTHFNGKRLSMLNQNDTMTFSPEAGQDAVAFTGSLQMPEKDHFQRISINLTAADAEGKELKNVSVTVSRGGSGSEQQAGSIFYIPFEIRTVALIIDAAAALIWCLAIIRNRVLNRKK